MPERVVDFLEVVEVEEQQTDGARPRCIARDLEGLGSLLEQQGSVGQSRQRVVRRLVVLCLVQQRVAERAGECSGVCRERGLLALGQGDLAPEQQFYGADDPTCVREPSTDGARAGVGRARVAVRKVAALGLEV